uniref:Uncharacterized protein n=1 Tax=Timema monikensis TaxID=170555 RepID=A0A7R9HT63_9NEOP|nr:unnamed protein product [Timema monikensis]
MEGVVLTIKRSAIETDCLSEVEQRVGRLSLQGQPADKLLNHVGNIGARTSGVDGALILQYTLSLWVTVSYCTHTNYGRPGSIVPHYHILFLIARTPTMADQDHRATLPYTVSYRTHTNYGRPGPSCHITIYFYLSSPSGFFPAAINFLRRVPLLGTVLNLPGIRTVIDRLAGDSSRTTV